MVVFVVSEALARGHGLSQRHLERWGWRRALLGGDDRIFRKGRRISNNTMAEVQLESPSFYGESNYTRECKPSQKWVERTLAIHPPRREPNSDGAQGAFVR